MFTQLLEIIALSNMQQILSIYNYNFIIIEQTLIIS